MLMKKQTLINTVFHQYSITLFSVFIALCMNTSCVSQHETITDIYYISNDLDTPIALEFSHSIVWDTCSVGTLVPVKYSNSGHIEILEHQRICLHPITREFKYPSAHKIEPGHLMGETTKLIIRQDTIVWQSKYGHMITLDDEWNIYNTIDWTTVSSQDSPNTYNSTFVISASNIERSKSR